MPRAILRDSLMLPRFILTTLWGRYYYSSYFTDGLREAKWYDWNPQLACGRAEMWMTPGSFIPNPMASLYTTSALGPGGESGLRRQHAGALKEVIVQKRRQGDRMWQCSYNGRQNSLSEKTEKSLLTGDILEGFQKKVISKLGLEGVGRFVGV